MRGCHVAVGVVTPQEVVRVDGVLPVALVNSRAHLSERECVRAFLRRRSAVRAMDVCVTRD